MHGALRPLPQPRHGDRRRDLRRAGRGARRAAGRRAGGRQAAHRRRHAVADDPLLPERPRARSARRSPPSAGRARPRWAGERELDLAVYETEVECDWTSGSFMFCRREALLSAGLLDERFFIYSEEPDLCLRMKRAGWGTRHLPTMTIVHHAGKGGLRPKMIAQDVFTRRQYAAQALRRRPIARPTSPPSGPGTWCAPPPPGVGSGRSGGRPPGWPCARSWAARRRRSARRRRRRSAARARASRLAGSPPAATRSGGLPRRDVSGTKRSGTSWRTFGGAYAPPGVRNDMSGSSV